MGIRVEQMVRGRENLERDLHVKIIRRRELKLRWRANRMILCRKLGNANDWSDAGRNMKIEGEMIRMLSHEIYWQLRYFGAFTPI